MEKELTLLLKQQINEGGVEDKIQDITLKLIDTDGFQTFPPSKQDLIYELNMNDLNELTREDYTDILQKLLEG